MLNILLKASGGLIGLTVGSTLGLAVSFAQLPAGHSISLPVSSQPSGLPAVRPASTLPVTANPDKGNRLLTTPQLQGGFTNTARVLQGNVPADKLQGNEGEALDTIQGNRVDEPQPALGYGALNWTLQ